MSNSFTRFKERVRAQAIGSAALLGFGAGAVAIAAIMLVSKLKGTEASPLYYGLAAGASVLIAIALYFIFMPSDRRLARRLDTLYSLNEKVSTMIELSGEQDGFALLQREDADAKLAEQPVRSLKSGQLTAGIIAFALSVVCVLGAWIVPARADDGETPINEFDKQWIVTALGELINTVETSYVDDGLKATSAAEIRSLLSFVEGSQLLSEMKTEAVGTVIAVSSALKSANSAEAIAEQLLKSSNDDISALGKSLGALSGSGSKRALEDLGKTVSDSDADDASFIADEMSVYLQSSGVRADDTLYLMFKSLISIARNDGSEAEDAFKEAGKKLSTEVIVQNVNKAVISDVIGKLCNLFGITEADIEAVDPEADVDVRDPSGSDALPDDSEVEDPDINMGTGGLGTGDVIYGSDDLIYDPYTNTYRPYGDIIEEYFAKANEHITDGKTSDEITDAAEEYFSTLFGGSNKDE